MNFSQLKAALNIESNGNLDHHLKKLDTLIYLDVGGLYKLSDDGKEAIQAVQVMAASIHPKKEPAISKQSNRVFYAFLAITCIFPVSIAIALFAFTSIGTSLDALIAMTTGLTAVFVGLLAAVAGFKKNIKLDLKSAEPLTYFPSSRDPWSRGDWYRNVGYFGSFLAIFFSIVFIEFSPIDFPGKFGWVVLSILTLVALGFTSQGIIYAVLEKANSRIHSNQTQKNTTA
jgi:hypothetical protein